MNTNEPREAVLITGAGGYVGSLVTAALAARREGIKRIVAADVRECPAEDRIPGVTYVTLDIREPDLAWVLEEHNIDTVVHLAAIVTPGPGQTRELQYSVDVEGTRNVLQACVAHGGKGRRPAGRGAAATNDTVHGVRKLIITSSGAAYGYHADNASYLDEESPLRGNEAFAYAHHKRLVEQMLADYRQREPQLEQLVFRVGTILGESVSNQITALFEKKVVLGLSGVSTPFVFIWDGDVVACIEEGIHTDKAGVFNLAGDGAVTLREIASRLGKPYVALPESLVTAALTGLQWLGRTQYGPEQVGFLKHRPVLLNRRLKEEFGYCPRYTSREVFELYQHGTQS